VIRIPNHSLLTPRYHEVASDSTESGLIKSRGVLIVTGLFAMQSTLLHACRYRITWLRKKVKTGCVLATDGYNK
jgi:hypothetical protein